MWIRDKPRIKDKRGYKTEYITVLHRLHNYKKGDRHTHWLCVCKCGNLIELSTNIINKSKGCKTCAFEGINVKHGKRKTRLYRIYQGMKERCYKTYCKNYENYGGRGISVCDAWLTNFDVFYKWAMSHGYANNLTIDRIDVNGNYEPNNCRWVDCKTQQNNRTNNIYILVNGEKLTMKQACEKYNKNYTNELRRYHRMSNEYEFIC